MHPPLLEDWELFRDFMCLLTMKQITAALSLLLLTTPSLGLANPLERDLSAFIAKFDLSAVSPDAKSRLADVINTPTMNHGMKVLVLHEILLSQDALEHVDQHGASPTAMTGVTETGNNG